VTVEAERFRARLEAERVRVEAAIENLRSAHPGSMGDEVDESSLDNHLAETASVTIDREIDYSLEENETRVLAAIDAALARIDDGSFGRCERCGGQIEEERLEAIPYATLCIEDKRLDERG
jgi:DnaK suppressor protein